MPDIEKKIDDFVKDKKVNKVKMNLDAKHYPSFLAMKKLAECDWTKQEHLKDMIQENFTQLMDSDDPVANSFKEKLYKECKTICEQVINQYMVDNNNDSLPNH